MVHLCSYADWLSEQEDASDRARGEFIAVQMRLEDDSLPKKQREQLRQREGELLEAHQREWLGGLATYLLGPMPEGDYDRDWPTNYRFRFARGWLDSAGHPQTESLRITERMRRRDFGHMDYEITIDDPKAFTRPRASSRLSVARSDPALAAS